MANFNELSQSIQRHLISLAEQTDVTPRETAIERVTDNWIEKRRLYTEQTGALAMVSETRFADDDRRGAMLLTYSGSLISIGPATGSARRLEYASIKLRTDVPGLLKGDDVVIAEEIALNRPAVFEGAPLARSSEILSIASFESGVPTGEQTERLRQAMIFLTNGFVQANQTLSLVHGGYPDQFTMREMVKSVAAHNDTTQTVAKAIIDDFLGTVAAGVLLGKRVSIGAIGRMELSVKPARKARMGRNPATGEELLIPSKPATSAPKMSFAKTFKERSSRVPPERIRPDLAEEGGES